MNYERKHMCENSEIKSKIETKTREPIKPTTN